MKTLYESILSSTKSGIRPTIEKWCNDHKIFDGKYEINGDNTISPLGRGSTLYLHYEDYNELPDYIRFKPAEGLAMVIGPERGGSTRTMQQITSFRGLPDSVYAILINIVNQRVLPELKIKVENVFTLRSSFINTFINLEVDFTGSTVYSCECNLKTGAPLKNVKITGAKILNIVNDFNLGDDFSKAMIRKAELNKYRGKYTTPVTDAGLEVINTFFGDAIDMSKLQEIDYTQNSRVVKHDGKWYRCKNW